MRRIFAKRLLAFGIVPMLLAGCGPSPSDSLAGSYEFRGSPDAARLTMRADYTYEICRATGRCGPGTFWLENRGDVDGVVHFSGDVMAGFGSGAIKGFD